MSERYDPMPAPATYDKGYMDGELWKLRAVIDSLAHGELHNAEPAKVWTGLIVQADGSNWNPGSGAGTYIYKAGTGWILLA